jgi:hypothetical protein
MGQLRLIRRWAEKLELTEINHIPKGTRGIYALLKKRVKKAERAKYDVVYIGMSVAGAGIQARLRAHAANPTKRGLWSHFSIYSVWPNITDEEVKELEGLFRSIYRRDSMANRLAVQKRYAPLSQVRDKSVVGWKSEGDGKA